jgi:pheromone shutdown-related protein TraB
MITLVGTGHVFNLSQALLNIFDDKQPEILCVELDKQRYDAMMIKHTNPDEYKDMKRDVPIIYKLLSRFQDGMAKEYGVIAGEEMLTAINYAKNHQLPVAFIDMNAQRLFSRMLKSMSFYERIKLMFSGFAGLFVNKKKVEKEIDKIEENFDKYLEEIRKKFPTIKRVLIDERNQYMAKQLETVSEKFNRVVAIVGDGHIPGLLEILTKKELEFEAIRLTEIRNIDSKTSDSSTATFSMEYKKP